jgi:Winged helix DNA-binding domain
MRITARQLNRATLARQLLLRREPLGVVDAIRRVVALQAQEPASPYVALWNRLTAFNPVELDAAFADREIVKATLMRITLHAVHADDHPAMHAAMQPTLRAARLSDRRFESSGLSADDAHALVPEFLEFAAQPHSAAEVEAWLGARLGVHPKGVWWALRQFGPMLHAPTGGPWSFGSRPSFVAAGTSAPPRLMAMWDSVLLAYADRSRIIPPDYRKLVARSNGDVLPTLLVDGYVAGVWRPVEGGIEATAFQTLSDEAWDGLASEARALTALLADREPQVYRRYSRWWTGLPRAEVRVLSG